MNRNKNKNGEPEVLYISREAIAITIEDTYEGEGVKYIRADIHERRVQDLLEANNRYLFELRQLKQKSKPYLDTPDQYKLSDEEIDAVWGNACFGEGRGKREIIIDALLKIAGHYATGYTILCICQELGLVTRPASSRYPRLTARGRRVLFWGAKNG